jgi:hypothetical protein
VLDLEEFPIVPFATVQMTLHWGIDETLQDWQMKTTDVKKREMMIRSLPVYISLNSTTKNCWGLKFVFDRPLHKN